MLALLVIRRNRCVETNLHAQMVPNRMQRRFVALAGLDR